MRFKFTEDEEGFMIHSGEKLIAWTNLSNDNLLTIDCYKTINKHPLKYVIYSSCTKFQFIVDDNIPLESFEIIRVFLSMVLL